MTAKPYTLLDADAQHAATPDTFEIPSLLDRETLRPGDLAKLCFLGKEPETGCEGERIWVEVTGTSPGGYTGTLANDPFYLPLGYGQQVEFTSANVLSIGRAHGDAMVAEYRLAE